MALIRRLVAAISCMGVMGCAPLIDDSPPPGFVEAESDWQSQHDKGKGSVGLRVTIYDNVDGGTLDYVDGPRSDRPSERATVCGSHRFDRATHRSCRHGGPEPNSAREGHPRNVGERRRAHG